MAKAGGIENLHLELTVTTLFPISSNACHWCSIEPVVYEACGFGYGLYRALL